MSSRPSHADVAGRKVCFLQNEARRSLVGEENSSNVRIGRPHPGAEKPIVRFPEPSAKATCILRPSPAGDRDANLAHHLASCIETR